MVNGAGTMEVYMMIEELWAVDLMERSMNML